MSIFHPGVDTLGHVADQTEQCDEKRPVCDKCSVHYANIQKCDYGDESSSGQESSTKKQPVARKSRHTPQAVPILPKSRHEKPIEPLTLAGAIPSKWDPFTQHPPSVEPDINLLMGTCGFMPEALPYSRCRTDYAADFKSHIFNIFPYVSAPICLLRTRTCFPLHGTGRDLQLPSSTRPQL